MDRDQRYLPDRGGTLPRGVPRSSPVETMMLERLDTHALIRLQGDATVGTAAGLKAELMEAMSTGRDLRADLTNVEEIDLTAMQLLWAADRDARQNGRSVTVQASAAAVEAALELGFGRFPGQAA